MLWEAETEARNCILAKLSMRALEITVQRAKPHTRGAKSAYGSDVFTVATESREFEELLPSETLRNKKNAILNRGIKRILTREFKTTLRMARKAYS